jgi:hypothetical protein
MESVPLLDRTGRRRSPAILSSFHVGRPPRNRGLSRGRGRRRLRKHFAVGGAGEARSKVLLAFYSGKYPASRACQWELTAAFIGAELVRDPRQRVPVANPEVGGWA